MDLEVLRTMVSLAYPMSKLTIMGISYFAAYEVTKKALTPTGSSATELNLGAIIMAGGTAGVAMWSLAIPPDVRLISHVSFPDIDRLQQVLKSRLQSAPSGTYSGFFDCLRKTVAQDGLAALWKGFGPAMARVSWTLLKLLNVLITLGVPRQCRHFRE